MAQLQKAAPCERLQLLEVKTARFALVVEKCGAPVVYTLWQLPEKDRSFQALVRNHRIMTILPNGSGAEFGVADFCKGKAARYLVFPRSVKRFADKRVVGIKWELLEA